jgi:hypothetical protein
MLNQQIAGMFIAGQQLLQGVTGETVTIANEDYPALAGDIIQESRLWEQGGASEILQAFVSVLKSDLTTAPLTNTLCVFRGYDLRVNEVGDYDTFWYIKMIQERA